MDPVMSQPPVLHRETVLGEWVDYNDHMNVAYYVLVFDHTTDVFLEQIGINEDYRASNGGSVFVVESHIVYGQEVLAGSTVEISTQLLDADDKRMHLFHTMRPDGSENTVATIEIMLLHVNLTTRKSSSFADDVRGRILSIADQHSQFPRPKNAGRHVAFRING